MNTAPHLPLRIWIDLANSPHVMFFAPIVRDLKAAGHTVILTARDFCQTLQLAHLFGLKIESLGAHCASGPLRKIANITGRAWALRKFARSEQFDLAISHNSYAQCLAARSLGITTVTLMDYEFQPANHISFRLAHCVMVPATFFESALRHYGASARRTFRYPGLKEEVYLQDYRPDGGFLKRVAECARRAGLAIGSEHVLITLRPPATMAAYHRFENPLFVELLNHLGGFENARLVVLPRTPAQANEIKPLLPANAFVPDETLDGRHLIYFSDLVVSAGGTMNREAAVLGTPVYSVFAPQLGSVDRHLVATGRLTLVQSREDFAKIRVEKKSAKPAQFAFGLRPLLITKFLEVAYMRRR